MIKTKIEGYNIEFAEKNDIPIILQFINDLAEYEKLSDAVSANTEMLENSLFGENPAAEVLISYYNGLPVGFAVFFHNFSTFLGVKGLYLEDLFIKPEYRGKGFGKTLLKFLANLAVQRNCGRFEWSVLDWNFPSIEFYKSLGAKPMDEWTSFRLSGNELKYLAFDL